MQVSTELKPLFSYSTIPIIFIGIIIVGLFILYFVKRKNKPRDNKIYIIEPPKKNIYQIKHKYLRNINHLLSNVNNNRISNRHAYQKLSLLIRHFIYEMTLIKVQNYSLNEIEKLNMPILSELVREYYDPEF